MATSLVDYYRDITLNQLGEVVMTAEAEEVDTQTETDAMHNVVNSFAGITDGLFNSTTANNQPVSVESKVEFA